MLVSILIRDDKINQDISIYSNRADSIFTTSCLPEDNIPLDRMSIKILGSIHQEITRACQKLRDL